MISLSLLSAHIKAKQKPFNPRNSLTTPHNSPVTSLPVSLIDTEKHQRSVCTFCEQIFCNKTIPRLYYEHKARKARVTTRQGLERLNFSASTFFSFHQFEYNWYFILFVFIYYYAFISLYALRGWDSSSLLLRFFFSYCYTIFFLFYTFVSQGDVPGDLSLRKQWPMWVAPINMVQSKNRRKKEANQNIWRRRRKKKFNLNTWKCWRGCFTRKKNNENEKR